MSCKYKYNNQWYTKEEVFSLLLKERNINSKGELIKPNTTTNYKWNVYAETEDIGDVMYKDPNRGFVTSFDTEKEAQQFANSQRMSEMYYVKRGNSKGISPKITNGTLKESIESVKKKLGIYGGKRDFNTYTELNKGSIVTVEGHVGEYYIESTSDSDGEIGIGVTNLFYDLYPINEFDPETNPNGQHPLFNVPEKVIKLKENNQKEYTSQALHNTKIAALKEMAKSYPLSLIRSEVRKSNTSSSQELSDQFDFQRIQEENELGLAPLEIKKCK